MKFLIAVFLPTAPFIPPCSSIWNSRVSQQKDIQNGNLLPISNVIFSSLNAEFFLECSASISWVWCKLKFWDKIIWNINLVKYYTINKFYETIPIITNKKGYQKWTKKHWLTIWYSQFLHKELIFSIFPISHY